MIWDEGKMTRQWPEVGERSSRAQMATGKALFDPGRPLVALSGLASGAGTPGLDPLGDPGRLSRFMAESGDGHSCPPLSRTGLSLRDKRSAWLEDFPGLLTSFALLLVHPDPMVTGGQDRTLPGHMEMTDVDVLTAFPARVIPGAHPRCRPLQRHHTIQNSDDAYVRWGPGAGEFGWGNTQASCLCSEWGWVVSPLIHPSQPLSAPFAGCCRCNWILCWA